MPERQEDRLAGQSNPALDEFVENLAKLNEGLSEMMAAALRMQMLMLEDAQNMMAEFGAAIDAPGGGGDNGNDV